MMQSGNGSVHVCAQNLLQIVSGEVPYSRVKGVLSNIIDNPLTTAESEVKEEAEFLIGTYEPRATINAINTTIDDGGAISISVDVSDNR